MSKNIKVQILKTSQNSKLENLLNSYNTLKSILSPNLSENNNLFMNSIIDLIISQLKTFLNLLYLNESKKIYEILNINNQNLSKQIAFLYDLPKFSDKISNKSLILRNENSNKKKDNYSLEEPKLSFNNYNYNYIDSANFDLTENQNEKESRDSIKDNENNEINENENEILKEIKINKNEKIKEKKMNEKNKEKEKEKEKEREREKKIRKDKEERERLKEKEKLIQNLKRQEKEREREIREKARKIIRKSKLKEKDSNKTQIKKKSNLPHKKNIKSIEKCHKNIIKLDSYGSKTLRENEMKTSYKKADRDEKYSEIRNKERNRTPLREKNKFKYYLFDFDNEKNSNSNSEDNENKFKRNNKRPKTVLYKPNQLINLNDLENIPIDKYISVTFTNRLLDRVKSPKKAHNKNNSIHIIVEEDEINKINKNNNIKNRMKTESSLKSKKNKKRNSNLSGDYFSLDEFLTPYNKKGGEELYLTKNGNVLINRKQKDILEDYINKNAFDDDEDSKYKLNKQVKEKVKSIKERKNKKNNLKGTNSNYDLNDINELFQILPPSFQVPIDDFYLRKKKASLFDRNFFKICHKVIDNYKELENKEDIFTFKSKSKSKSRAKSSKHFENSKKNSFGYKKFSSS